jgi:endonuclease YncB( thermonuclease family)
MMDFGKLLLISGLLLLVVALRGAVARRRRSAANSKPHGGRIRGETYDQGPWGGLRTSNQRAPRSPPTSDKGRQVAIAVAGFALGGVIVLLGSAFSPETPAPIQHAAHQPMSPPAELASGGAQALRLGERRSPISTADILVVDGDTIRVSGVSYRLVGFDTPEKGDRARCDAERALAERATTRLRQLLALKGVTFTQIACACKPGTEGTHACNYGRRCGAVAVEGRDVGAILINEGLAHRYACSGWSCQRKKSWC